MTLYDFNHYWNICLGAGSGYSNYLFSNVGPYGKTWDAVVTFGLNGGDNVQYAWFEFYLLDNQQGNIQKGYFAAGTQNWIQQGKTFEGQMTASYVNGFSMILNINNPDSVSQCFNAYVTLWYY